MVQEQFNWMRETVDRGGAKPPGRFKREVRFMDGWSESAWKSLAVKSLRMGWAVGIAEAGKRLAPSTLQACLLCSVFEDIFPAEGELGEVMAEIKRGDFTALCQRQTHHGRGYTARFCELEPQAVDAAKTKLTEMFAAARVHKLWLPPRAMNVFWTWMQIRPLDAGATRDVCHTPWTGMPRVMLDAHTYEGKRIGAAVTLLSGHYHNHLKLSQLVAASGWEPIRREALAVIEQGTPGNAEPHNVP